MRIAIIYKTDKVFVEFKPSVFKEMLKTYMELSERSKTAKKLDTAMEKIIKDLKNKTKYA